MYDNIDTAHALDVITWWIRDLDRRHKLSHHFNVEAVISAMHIIMRNNIFEFGVLRFLQILGTAMGTSAACMWATIYFGYYEEFVLLPKYGQWLLLYKRYIDDVFGIWVVSDDAPWDEFKADLDGFGLLTWEVSELSYSANFLDLTLSIVDGKIESRTFQKALNLYLYLPPTSAHPPGCIKGLIFGMVGRFYAHNTHRSDFVHFTKLLFVRLLN